MTKLLLVSKIKKKSIYEDVWLILLNAISLQDSIIVIVIIIVIIIIFLYKWI